MKHVYLLRHGVRSLSLADFSSPCSELAPFAPFDIDDIILRPTRPIRPTRRPHSSDAVSGVNRSGSDRHTVDTPSRADQRELEGKWEQLSAAVV